MRFTVLALLGLLGCTEYNLGGDPPTQDLSDPIPEANPGGWSTRDTDGDGIPDDQDPDADGDDIPNDLDPDPDGDEIPGWTLDSDPSDDPEPDETGLPRLEPGGARGRVCAPNGSTWIADADVAVITPSGTYETTTNGDGWWQISGLPVGTHSVIVRKGSFMVMFDIVVVEGEVSEVLYEECVEQGALDIAVVAGQYDSIGAVLSDLGIDYDVVNGYSDSETTAFLTDPTALAQYDLIFFNCGMSFDWLSQEELVANNIKSFVEDGGAIYASDWAYYIVEASFPDRHDFHGDDLEAGSAFRGAQGMVTANLLSPAMIQLLNGTSAAINYDLSSWVTIDQVGDVEVLLEGAFTFYNDSDMPEQASSALATRFSFGAGSVTYTTFHNEAQVTLDVETLLEDIVLSL